MQAPQVINNSKIHNSSSEILRNFSVDQEIRATLEDHLAQALGSDKHPRYFDTLELIKAVNNHDFLGKQKFENIIKTIESLAADGMSKKDIKTIVDCLFDHCVSYHNVEGKITHIINTLAFHKKNLDFTFVGMDNIKSMGIGGDCAAIAGYCFRYLSKHLSSQVKVQFVQGHGQTHFVHSNNMYHFFVRITFNGSHYIFDSSFGVLTKKTARYSIKKIYQENEVGGNGVIELNYANITQNGDIIDSIYGPAQMLGLYGQYAINIGYVKNKDYIFPFIATINTKGNIGYHYYRNGTKPHIDEDAVPEEDVRSFIETQLQRLPATKVTQKKWIFSLFK